MLVDDAMLEVDVAVPVADDTELSSVVDASVPDAVVPRVVLSASAVVVASSVVSTPEVSLVAVLLASAEVPVSAELVSRRWIHR